MDNILTSFNNWLIVNNCASMIYLSKIKEVINSISDFTEDNINAFIVKKRNENLAEETLNLYIKSIRAYLRFCKLEINTPKYFKPIQRIPEFITLEFLEKEILPLISDLFPQHTLKIKTLLYFMFYSGLRKSEIENLKRENFNFKEKELKVYILKTKEERLIPLSDKMVIMLQKYFNSEEEKYNAFNLGIGSLYYIFNQLKVNIKSINLYPHLFRNSFATYLLQEHPDKFSLLDVKELLGHHNIKSTMRYPRSNIKKVKEKFKNI